MLWGAPVKEGLAPEHGSELLADALEHLLDGGGVAQEGRRHLEALGRDVTHLQATHSHQRTALSLRKAPFLARDATRLDIQVGRGDDSKAEGSLRRGGGRTEDLTLLGIHSTK